MSPGRLCIAHGLVAGLLLVLPACGKKGPPLAPLHIAPMRIEDLQIEKTDDTVRATFTVPSMNDNKTQPADIAAVELYAITGKPEDPFGQPLSGGEFLRYATLAGHVEIQPPPEDTEEQGAKAMKRQQPPAPSKVVHVAGDARPSQGQHATIAEKITPANLTPFVHPRKKSAVKATPTVESTWVGPLAGPPADPPPVRVYVAIAVSSKGVESNVSNRVALPLLDSPPPPTGVSLNYDGRIIVPSWVAPEGARHAVQRAPKPDEIPARSLTTPTVTTAYNVYRASGPDVSTISAEPLTPVPVEDVTWGMLLPGFGSELCFAVRSVLVYGSARLESVPSDVACVTPIDKFPPAAPKGLVAVGSEGGVSLIWDSNNEPDLAGYVVMRGELGAGGAAPATLAPLMSEPIKETTYRDATAKAGVRYVYAVVAVDNASPRNVSPESNRVEEGAR